MKWFFMEIFAWWLDWWIEHPALNLAITFLIVGFFVFSAYIGVQE